MQLARGCSRSRAAAASTCARCITVGILALLLVDVTAQAAVMYLYDAAGGAQDPLSVRANPEGTLWKIHSVSDPAPASSSVISTGGCHAWRQQEPDSPGQTYKRLYMTGVAPFKEKYGPLEDNGVAVHFRLRHVSLVVGSGAFLQGYFGNMGRFYAYFWRFGDGTLQLSVHDVNTGQKTYVANDNSSANFLYIFMRRTAGSPEVEVFVDGVLRLTYEPYVAEDVHYLLWGDASSADSTMEWNFVMAEHCDVPGCVLPVPSSSGNSCPSSPQYALQLNLPSWPTPLVDVSSLLAQPIQASLELQGQLAQIQIGESSPSRFFLNGTAGVLHVHPNLVVNGTDVLATLEALYSGDALPGRGSTPIPQEEADLMVEHDLGAVAIGPSKLSSASPGSLSIDGARLCVDGYDVLDMLQAAVTRAGLALVPATTAGSIEAADQLVVEPSPSGDCAVAFAGPAQSVWLRYAPIDGGAHPGCLVMYSNQPSLRLVVDGVDVLAALSPFFI